MSKLTNVLSFLFVGFRGIDANGGVLGRCQVHRSPLEIDVKSQHSGAIKPLATLSRNSLINVDVKQTKIAQLRSAIAVRIFSDIIPVREGHRKMFVLATIQEFPDESEA